MSPLSVSILSSALSCFPPLEIVRVRGLIAVRLHLGRGTLQRGPDSGGARSSRRQGALWARAAAVARVAETQHASRPAGAALGSPATRPEVAVAGARPAFRVAAMAEPASVRGPPEDVGPAARGPVVAGAGPAQGVRRWELGVSSSSEPGWRSAGLERVQFWS